MLNDIIMTGNAEEIRSAISSTVNCYGINYKGEAEALRKDPAAAKKFFSIAAFWMKALAKSLDDNNYDLRNEAACHLGKAAERTEFVAKYTDPEIAFSKRAEMVCFGDGNDWTTGLIRNHRTLQQSFTRLCIRILRDLSDMDENIKPMLTHLEYTGNDTLPFI